MRPPYARWRTAPRISGAASSGRSFRRRPSGRDTRDECTLTGRLPLRRGIAPRVRCVRARQHAQHHGSDRLHRSGGSPVPVAVRPNRASGEPSSSSTPLRGPHTRTALMHPEKEYPFGLSTVTASRGQEEGIHGRPPPGAGTSHRSRPNRPCPRAGSPHPDQYAGGTRHRLRPPGPRARRTARHLVACRPLPRPCERELLHPPARTGHADTPSPRAGSASSPAPTGFADRVAPGFDDRGPLSTGRTCNTWDLSTARP